MPLLFSVVCILERDWVERQAAAELSKSVRHLMFNWHSVSNLEKIMSRMLKIVALCSVVLCISFFVSRDSNVAGQAPPAAHNHGSACADACASCANSCSSCVEHCLQMLTSGKSEHALTARLCNDCADLCSIAAKLESREGPLRVLVCEACAKACDLCAAECRKYKGDLHMADCAKACLKCAEACREMVLHAGHTK
jgi:hypothetical protein